MICAVNEAHNILELYNNKNSSSIKLNKYDIIMYILVVVAHYQSESVLSVRIFIADLLDFYMTEFHCARYIQSKIIDYPKVYM